MPPKKKGKCIPEKAKKTCNGKAKKNRKLFQYSEYQMNSALEDIRTSQISIRDAAKKYNVPRSTLSAKGRGVGQVSRKMGPTPILGSAIENEIVKCLITSADAGHPISKKQLLDNVADLASKQTENPFKNGRPGEKWFKLFCARHPSIRRKHFAGFLHQATIENVKPVYIQSELSTSGVLPSNFDDINSKDAEKDIEARARKLEIERKEFAIAFKHIGELIGSEKENTFLKFYLSDNAIPWNGAIEDTTAYYIWREAFQRSLNTENTSLVEEYKEDDDRDESINAQDPLFTEEEIKIEISSADWTDDDDNFELK